MKTKFLVAILLSIIMLGACAPEVTPSATEAIPEPTPFITSTSLPIALPTITASPTVTATAVPTYTPAAPEATYKVRKWSANDADLLGAQISSNLSAVEDEPIYQSVYGWSYYMEQYKYLAFAEEEALLRFPTSQQAEKWRWDLCYNLAFSYQYPESVEAPELLCYAKLIENGLNSGDTTLGDLSEWFANHENRFSFSITSFPVSQNFTSAHVITFEDNAFLWLLEQSGKFHATGLRSSMFFFRETSAKFQQLDLTGDNFPELILYFGRSFCCGAFSTQYVYDLSSETPQLLSFEDLSGSSTYLYSDYESYITPLDSKSEHPGLLFNRHYGYDPLDQPCNLRAYDKYFWNGSRFELAGTSFGIDPPGEYDDKEFCKFVSETAKEPDELEIAVRTIGDIRPGDPVVSRDQILYRLGEYQVRVGSIEKAKEYFNTALSLQSTDKPISKWAADAQIFVKNLYDKNSYYKTCSIIVDCDMRKALQQLIDLIEPNSFLSAPQLLESSGVRIKSSGYANFDASGNIEQWLVVQYPNRSEREFWILVQRHDKVYGLFVADIPANQPKLKEFQGSNDYLLTTSDGESLISLKNLSFSNQPYILTRALIENNDPVMENYDLQRYLVEEPVENITAELFNGADPALVKDELMQLQQTKSFDCKKSNLCDQVYYLQGLTSELMGDTEAATAAYVELWKGYPESLYTIMARAKLEILSR
jgi:hypothetical protein